MTFEGGRKKQVLVLQPRGKALYEDDSSFGSKMLAKMGWSKGQGLGKNQHGSVDFIQIRYKNNANGLGFNGLKDDQWTTNESNFDNLLKSLNNSNQNSAENSKSNSADEQQPSGKKSLEEKSKQSRARVHYKKFTKGKDVYKYSEKDLANILGKKSLKEMEKPVAVEETVEQQEEEKPGLYDSNLIINTGMSVTDYFKQKMGKKEKGKSDQVEKEEEANEQQEEIVKPEKKSKKRKNVEEIEEVPEELPKKKKKSKKTLEEDAIVEEEISTKKKKKTVEHVPEQIEEIPDDQQPKKSKKKKKTEPVEESIEVEQLEVPSKKSKKEKKIECETIEESPDLPKKSNKKSKKTEIDEPKTSKKAKTKNQDEPQTSGEQNIPATTSRGANLVYSTNVVQIPSHVAQKLANMSVDHFKQSNIANIVGYGMTEDIELKIINTKAGEISNNTDKYALYNTDRMTTKRVNPRKIMSKIKKTKKMIQVI